jgi:hypothetical protein
LYADFENYYDFKPADLHTGIAATMFDELESWTGALKTVRA